MFRVRSLTLHLPLEPGEVADPYRVLDEAWRRLNAIKAALREAGFSVWSLRVSFAPAEDLDAARLGAVAEAAKPYGEDLLVSLIHTACSDPGVEAVSSILPRAGNVYASLRADSAAECYKCFHRALVRLGRHASRLALLFTEHLQTPYFPAACSLGGEECISVALLYPRLVESRGFNGVREAGELAYRLEKVVREAAEDAGVGYCGIDASLSPWMSESVTAALEATAGRPIYSYGFALTVKRVNDAIMEYICSRVKCIGFNEAMLAVAEDDRLKEHAASGRLTLDTLIHLLYVCVAGLDMVAIQQPKPEVTRAILEEAEAARLVKGRTVGVRLIYAPPGARTIYIDDVIGSTPVIAYRAA